jgi:hypothetical protein
MNIAELPPLSLEFADAELADKRRTNRLIKLSDALAAAPGRSLPRQVGSDSELEATYRFLGNADVTPECVAEAHIRNTVRRAGGRGRVLVIHDTTEFSFTGEKKRSGLGRMSTDEQQGFYAHVALCTSFEGEPLGLLDLFAWRREPRRKGRCSSRLAQYDPDRESLRWHNTVHAVHERLCGTADALHVMDREGDSYELLADLLEHEQHFVIRLAHDRRLDSHTRRQQVPMLFETLEQASVVLEREVILGRRSGKRRAKEVTRFPARETRTTQLEVRAQRIEISTAKGTPAHLPTSLCLNFVEIREPAPPENEEPVLWRLVTTEPIDTPAEIERVVDAYRARWLIEEYFKAIKTGCTYEELQLEDAHGLLVALAIYSAVAWRLLLIRWLGRHQPDTAAASVLSHAQLEVLKAVRVRQNRPLPDSPTVKDVLLAIAALGGHLKRNGAPGWLVLRRGFDELLKYEIGWWAAQPLRRDTCEDVINP